MRLFVDHQLGRDGGQLFYGPLKLWPDRGLDEIEWATGSGLPAFALYRIPITSTISYLAACCGDTFDAMLDEMVRAPVETIGQELADHWHNFVVVYLRGQNGDLSDLGLTRVTDPHDGVKKGCLATVLSHRASPAEIRHAVVRVIEGTVATIAEGVEAAAGSRTIGRVLGRSNDLYRIDALLEAMTYGFEPEHIDRMLDR
ncbi:hypothetical protein [Catenulispora rubra]|uniref:hypothetical protein n=1 Tax=Catenulispora rubra TaxID=280293 RepID=UPI0018924CB0|nr:hypothetical protein [Catenulispora rubra]